MERRSFIRNIGLGSITLPVLSAYSNGTSSPKELAHRSASNSTPMFNTTQQIRSGIALGGIGAGSIEMRPDGNFYNWSIFNNYPKGSGKPFIMNGLPHSESHLSLLFFIVKYQVEGSTPKFKLLQLNNSINEAAMTGITYYYPWMTAVQQIEYTGVFPFVELKYTDPEMPFEVYLKAFSPFIPHDTKNSALPGVYFDFEIISTTDKKVEVSLLASLRNLVGYDTTEKYFKSALFQDETVLGFTHQAGGMPTDASSFGEMGLSVIANEASYYLGWEHKHPYYERLLVEKQLANLDDTPNRNKKVPGTERLRGHFTGKNTKDQRCFSTLAAHGGLSQGNSMKVSFIFSWYFPNAYGSYKISPTEFDGEYQINQQLTAIQGNYYNNFFESNQSVASYLVVNRKELLARSKAFQGDFFNSSLPDYVLHQVSSQFNTFITSSTFTQEGRFAIREGLSPSQPWGPNGTIDVSLYASIMIVALFPELQKSMMRVHKEVQTTNGEIAHGLANQLNYTENGTWGVYHRLDLVPNYIQMVLRDYLFTDDKAYIEEMWPSIIKGIDYILEERDKDGDLLPEMEGVMCSYDNFPMYGHASYILSQWASAMTMANLVATQLGKTDDASRFADIAQKAVAAMEKNLWNGKYYRLYNDTHGGKGMDEGCLTDQLIGVWTAHQAGIHDLLPADKVKSALSEILARSYKDGFLRNCSWPQYPDYFPIEKTDWWVDQANTPWTGVELGFASLLYHYGMVEEAYQVIRSVDERYRKAGLYWDHQEFGGHYLRPMSAWGIIHAALGYSVRSGVFTFDPQLPEKGFTLFFTSSAGTAHFIRKSKQDQIKVRTGILKIKEILLGHAKRESPTMATLNTKLAEATFIAGQGSKVHIKFKSEIELQKGDVLTLV